MREGLLIRVLRQVLGLRRQTVIDGVTYREAKAVPLERALASPKRPGKRYTVVFPSGRSMTITATRQRRYADLIDIPELRSLRLAESLVRPGSRVLLLGGGTGAMAAMIASWVGPHGGVVSVEHDGESVRFARRRYPMPGVSIERGGAETLAGEMDESFDVVFAVEPWLDRVEDRRAALAEAWRLTRRGGRLIAIDDAEARTAGEYLGFDAGPVRVEKRSPTDGGPVLLVIERVEPERGAI